MKLAYPTKSEDPIFPADYLAAKIGNNTFWMSSLSHATVLGCVDEYEICDADTLSCWNGTFLDHEIKKGPFFQGSTPITSTYFSHEARQTFLAIDMALIQSNTYNSIRTRGAQALDAQSRYSDPISTALDPQQWKLELRKIFRVSLARSQLVLVDIASGTGSDTPGFVNQLSPLQKQYICMMVKVRANGKNGVSVTGLVLLFCVCAAVVVASINPHEELVVVRFIWVCSAKSLKVVKVGVVMLFECLSLMHWTPINMWGDFHWWLKNRPGIRL